MTLSSEETKYLAHSFKDLINYESVDPEDPINPFTYREPSGDNCLHIASRLGNHKAVAILLKAGFDIDEKGDMGNTALHYAYKGKHQDIIELLLKNGASDEIINEFGDKPSKS